MGQREAVAAFLQAAVEGEPRRHASLFAPDARHHNPYFPAGMDALFDAMEDAARQAPQATYQLHRFLVDGDLVAAHGHVVQQPGTPGIAAVHIFRFHGEHVIEVWDVAAVLPEDSPNDDGVF